MPKNAITLLSGLHIWCLKSIISLSTYQPDIDHGYGMYLTENPIFEGVPELGFDRQGYRCTQGT